MSNTETSQDPQRVNPWLSPWALAAAALLVLILAMSVVIVIGNGNDDTAAPGAADPSTPRSAAPSKELDTAIPTTGPPARWELYQTVALPVSDTAGPAVIDGDVSRGFAHSPTGALVASVQLSNRYRLAPDWRAVARTSIAPGPGRDAWLTLRSTYGKLDPPSPGTLCQMAGFKFVDYTPNRTVIQSAQRCPSNTFQSATTTLAWDGSDWQLVLQPDGSESPTVVKILDISSYTSWGGV